MSDWLAFEGEIRTMSWGKAVYTVLPLPEDVVDALEAAGAKRVEGEIAEHPVNLAVTRAPASNGPFLWTGKALLDRIGARPGDIVEARLRPASPDAVETPDDLAAALSAADAEALWAALTPGKRRGHLYKLDSARTAETRAKRLAALVSTLAGDA